MREETGRAPSAGLCRSCRWRRIIESRRGSRFVLCQRSRTDARYPRYPALPVVACPGHEPMDEVEGAV